LLKKKEKEIVTTRLMDRSFEKFSFELFPTKNTGYEEQY